MPHKNIDLTVEKLLKKILAITFVKAINGIKGIEPFFKKSDMEPCAMAIRSALSIDETHNHYTDEEVVKLLQGVEDKDKYFYEHVHKYLEKVDSVLTKGYISNELIEGIYMMQNPSGDKKDFQGKVSGRFQDLMNIVKHNKEVLSINMLDFIMEEYPMKPKLKPK